MTKRQLPNTLSKCADETICKDLKQKEDAASGLKLSKDSHTSKSANQNNKQLPNSPKKEEKENQNKLEDKKLKRSKSKSKQVDSKPTISQPFQNSTK